MADLTPEQLDEIERRARSVEPIGCPLTTVPEVLSLIAEVRWLRRIQSQVVHLRERGFYIDHDDTEMHWKPLHLDVIETLAESTGWEAPANG